MVSMMVPVFLVAAWFCWGRPASCATQQQPHIVTIMVDDMGWNDVGFHGSNQIPTPNIDALAYNGVVLERHYTLPTCTPSRTAHLTGKYPIRTGMQGFPLFPGEPRGLPLEEVTLPQRLRELGYVTRLVGKWHQGSYKTEFTPTQRGFDSFLGYWNGFIGYFDYTSKVKEFGGLDFHRDNCSTDEFVGRYVTDVLTEEAVNIINSHDDGRPLYMHLAHLAVHSGNTDKLLEVADPEDTERRFGYIESPERRLYAGMVSKLDESVGKVVSALSDRGLLNNTILVFMTDNGAQTYGFLQNSGSNWPLRGMKFTQFEGGVRGLATLWSPLLNKPGRVSNQLFHITDWLPTLYSAAGGDVSKLGDLDGVDQWASLLGEPGAEGDPRQRLLLNLDLTHSMEAFIDRGWKVTRGDYDNGVYDGYFGDDGRSLANPGYDILSVLNSEVNQALPKARREMHVGEFRVDKSLVLKLRSKLSIDCVPKVKSVNNNTISCVNYCLFDVVNDPCETRDFSSKHPTKVEELKVFLDKYRKEVVPQTNLPIDPASNPALYGGRWVPWRDEPPLHPHQCSVEMPPSEETEDKRFLLTMVVLVLTLGLANRVFSTPIKERYLVTTKRPTSSVNLKLHDGERRMKNRKW